MIVNLERLLQELRPQVAAATLRKIIAENPDFPVVARGREGVEYQFDLDTALAWWASFQRRRALEIEEREQRLAREIVRIYGAGAGAADDDDRFALSLEARKKAAEIAYLEDRNRRIRGELIERGPFERALVVAVTRLRNKCLQIPAEFTKRRGGLARDEIEILTDMVELSMNSFPAELAAALRGQNGSAGGG